MNVFRPLTADTFVSRPQFSTEKGFPLVSCPAVDVTARAVVSLPLLGAFRLDLSYRSGMFRREVKVFLRACFSVFRDPVTCHS